MSKLLILVGEALGDIRRSSGARTELLADVPFIIELPLAFHRIYIYFFLPQFRSLSVMNSTPVSFAAMKNETERRPE